MPSTAEQKKTVRLLIKGLAETYRSDVTALTWRNPFELLCATILSAQCTDERVNMITPVLFKAYPTARKMARARQGDVEKIIRSAGFFRSKAQSLITSAGLIMDNFGGRVPRTMEDLVTLRGVSRKTANIVLSHAYGVAAGIAVDTHVKRIAKRVGLTGHTDPAKVETDLLDVIPEKYWLQMNAWLVQFGRDICPARKPECWRCFIKKICPSATTVQPRRSRSDAKGKA